MASKPNVLYKSDFSKLLSPHNIVFNYVTCLVLDKLAEKDEQQSPPNAFPT